MDQKYTVVEAYEDIRVRDINTEQVIVQLENGDGERIDVCIELEAFDDMSGKEISAAIRRACRWHVTYKGKPVISMDEGRNRAARLESLLRIEVTV